MSPPPLYGVPQAFWKCRVQKLLCASGGRWLMDMHTNIGRLARLEPLYGTSRRAYRVYVRVKARTARFKQSDAEREREG